MQIPWTQDTFAASVTGRTWTYTEYDGGWEKCRNSAELRALFAEEMALDAVPDWVREIVERMLASPLPPCGHYTFPRPILQICEAIGQERCPEFVIGCYTADSSRKALASHYVFCLDAWLQQAPLAVASAESNSATPATETGAASSWKSTKPSENTPNRASCSCAAWCTGSAGCRRR